MLIPVIIPGYNAEKHLAQELDSGGRIAGFDVWG